MTAPPTMPVPQPEVTLRLPFDGERVHTPLDEDTLAILSGLGDAHFIVPAGTVVLRRIDFTEHARWAPEYGWIFEVRVGEGRLWVRPASDLAVSPVTWEEVPLVNVEAPDRAPE